MLGLYDQQGVLRFSGRDRADCLAYAELFALAEGSFSLEPLQHEPPSAGVWASARPAAASSS
ncbi:MAG: hypothetical protein FJ056_01690 [Cyanobacteria bacterium M_surface_10_m2_179]|nr:hypothetical protein [Cyanobacteria bacterium M_surface_10_m2_179]